MGDPAGIRIKAGTRSRRQRSLRLEYTGNLIKHLGLQMYAGAVPALAELVSNAWDADASQVRITIPFGQSLTDDHLIRIEDNGRGMTFEEVAYEYLVIGRDRRVAKGTKTPKGRDVLGRKGIGKLAGFGIANIVEVRTVRNKWLTHFAMDYRDMTSPTRAQYVERYEPTVLADEEIDERNGTTIILRELLISRRIDENEFRESMARRFAILSAQFEVFVDGKPIEPFDESELRFRMPARGKNVTHVQGFGKVEWWLGITPKPIKIPEGRGVSIFAHGKLVQTPFLFNIHGGMHAQHLTQYLTGEIFADRLDEEEDYIATGRQSVNWDHNVPHALEVWGQDLVRKYIAAAYQKSEAEKDAESFQALDGLLHGSLTSRLEKLPESHQRQAKALVTSLRKIRETDASKDYAAAVANGIVSIYEEGIGNWTPAKLLEGDDVLEEYGSFDAARVRSLIRDRQEFLQHFLAHLKESRRKDARVELIRQNPWVMTGVATLPIADPVYTKEVQSLWRRRNREIADRVTLIAGHLSASRFIIAIEGTRPTAAILDRWKRSAEWLPTEESRLVYFVSHRETHHITRNGISLGSLDQFCKIGLMTLRKLNKVLSESTK